MVSLSWKSGLILKFGPPCLAVYTEALKNVSDDTPWRGLCSEFAKELMKLEKLDWVPGTKPSSIMVAAEYYLDGNSCGDMPFNANAAIWRINIKNKTPDIILLHSVFEFLTEE